MTKELSDDDDDVRDVYIQGDGDYSVVYDQKTWVVKKGDQFLAMANHWASCPYDIPYIPYKSASTGLVLENYFIIFVIKNRNKF